MGATRLRTGDLLRFNPHFHALILEGGFDAAGRFIFIPLGDLARMTQYLRRRVLKLFLDKRLISRSFAENLLRWRHSGFSIDHSVRLHAHDQQARWALSQYIARPPLSLKKLLLDGIGAKVLLKSAYNPYFKENLKRLSATEFIGELTQHLPPHRMRCIRYYGLYSSRSRGKWHLWSHIAAHAPEGWKHTAVGLSSESFASGATQAAEPVSATRASSTWELSSSLAFGSGVGMRGLRPCFFRAHLRHPAAVAVHPHAVHPEHAGVLLGAAAPRRLRRHLDGR